MDDRTFRTSVIAGAVVLYAALFGVSVMGFGSGQSDGATSSSDRQTRPPRVLYHDDDVDVYSRRSVRAGSQRGGGIRGGK
jgi:hypothetical protein